MSRAMEVSVVDGPRRDLRLMIEEFEEVVGPIRVTNADAAAFMAAGPEIKLP